MKYQTVQKILIIVIEISLLSINLLICKFKLLSLFSPLTKRRKLVSNLNLQINKLIDHMYTELFASHLIDLL